MNRTLNTPQNSDVVLNQVCNLLECLDTDYLLVLFPTTEEAGVINVGASIEDAALLPTLLSRSIMQGGDLGWQLFLLFRVVCKQIPIPLDKLLTLTRQEYDEYITVDKLIKSVDINTSQDDMTELSSAFNQKL